MRRKDREITDDSKIDEIINEAFCMRLGFNDDGEVYIVPLNFGFENIGGKRFFYFHGAKEGRKIDLALKNPNVGFELDTGYKLKFFEDDACKTTAAFKSVIGNGKLIFIEDNAEKKRALNLLMKHTTGKGDFNYPKIMLDRVAILRLEVEKLSCKVHES